MILYENLYGLTKTFVVTCSLKKTQILSYGSRFKPNNNRISATGALAFDLYIDIPSLPPSTHLPTLLFQFILLKLLKS